MTTSGLSTVVAVVLGATALIFNALSVPQPVAPTTVDLSLIITGLGAAGEPATHHFYNPQMVVTRKGDTVRLRVMNLSFASHAIQVDGYGARTKILSGGDGDTISFVAEKGGMFSYRCYIPHDPATGACSPDHETMIGYLVVLDPLR